MERGPGRAPAGEGCGGRRRHHHRNHAVPRRAYPRDPARPRGPPRQLRRDGLLHRRRRGGQAHEARPARHVQARHRHDGADEAAARRARLQGLLGGGPDVDAAPAAAHPEVRPRQGPGPAQLLPVHAVLARRLRRQRRGDGRIPRGNLRLRPAPRPRRHPRARRADRIRRNRPLPSRPARPHHHRPRRHPRPGGARGHRRPDPDARLCAFGGHRALRRGDPRPRGPRPARAAGLRRRPRRAPRHRRLFPQERRDED